MAKSIGLLGRGLRITVVSTRRPIDGHLFATASYVGIELILLNSYGILEYCARYTPSKLNGRKLDTHDSVIY